MTSGQRVARRNLLPQFDDVQPSTSGGAGAGRALQSRQPKQQQIITAARPPATAMEAANKLLVEQEKYKAGIAAPKGMIPIDDNVRMLRQLDPDDDFFHVTCHIDNALQVRIQNGEFVELERLLPHDRSGFDHGFPNAENVMELVSRGGQTYFAPARDRAKINNVRKWDQAFRIYVAIYSEANLSRAVEIWQYIYVIHKAASVYNWDNVSFYDQTFRQLMATKPWRSWSKTYVQAWNVAMNEPITKSNFNSEKFAGNKSEHSWRDDCCWKFNKNKCKKSAQACDFDHRCTYCGGWYHNFLNCRKRKNSSGNGNSNGGNPSNGNKHTNHGGHNNHGQGKGAHRETTSA